MCVHPMMGTLSQHLQSHPSTGAPQGHYGRQKCSVTKMDEKCINCRSAHPGPPSQTRGTRDPKTLFWFTIENNLKIQDLQPQKAWSHFFDSSRPHPQPPRPTAGRGGGWHKAQGTRRGGGVYRGPPLYHCTKTYWGILAWDKIRGYEGSNHKLDPLGYGTRMGRKKGGYVAFSHTCRFSYVAFSHVAGRCGFDLTTSVK